MILVFLIFSFLGRALD